MIIFDPFFAALYSVMKFFLRKHYDSPAFSAFLTLAFLLGLTSNVVFTSLFISESFYSKKLAGIIMLIIIALFSLLFYLRYNKSENCEKIRKRYKSMLVPLIACLISWVYFIITNL